MGVGVYGQGADVKLSIVPPIDTNGSSIPGSNVTSGPSAAGVGVLGHGGDIDDPSEKIEDRIRSGAGVVGLAGNLHEPELFDRQKEAVDAGVYGAGVTGVIGHGDAWGVRAWSDSDFGAGILAGFLGAGLNSGRGGVFQSDKSAQVRLFPISRRQIIPDRVTVTPTALPEGLVALPKNGQGGDLMTIEMDAEGNKRECTLSFCVQGVDVDPARWAQVLLGPIFDGKA
jgi:hypothetical protein